MWAQEPAAGGRPPPSRSEKDHGLFRFQPAGGPVWRETERIIWGRDRFYSTGSKKDASNPIGVEALRTIKQSVNIPVVAIGGINASNLNEVKSTGVDGISVISAILSRDDTFAAARELVELWRK